MTTTQRDVTKRNQLIFIGYYLTGKSSKELADAFGISRQAVEKIVKTILEKRNKK